MTSVEPFSEAYPLHLPSFERRLFEAVIKLRNAAMALERSAAGELERVHVENAVGARNLLHYLAVRQHDVRELQTDLASLGLSSLGRMEKCVLYTLERVAYALARLDNAEWRPEPVSGLGGCARAQSTLARSTANLLGPEPKTRFCRIMVTLSVEMDVDELTVLLERGMNVARVNCAKGDQADWLKLVNALERARRRVGVECPVQFDLAGPNPRSRLFGPAAKQVPAYVGGRIALAMDKDAAEFAHKEHKKAAIVGCTLPEVVPCLQVGERFSYDGGKLLGTVTERGPGIAWLEVTHCNKPELRLKKEKGLNFPDSQLALPSLTPKDLEDLEFVADHADIIALSFVRSPADVEAVQAYLADRDRSQVGILLKVETQQAFNQLAKLLLVALRSPKVGVMVARGDMATELGFLRLSEAQEEVLWLAEAALVPVVWATQVLECMTKTGVPSRAEVTDSAMAGRAEAVMLNRGRYVPESVTFLDDVLRRMQAHQDKKRSLLRRLHISELPLTT